MSKPTDLQVANERIKRLQNYLTLEQQDNARLRQQFVILSKRIAKVGRRFTTLSSGPDY